MTNHSELRSRLLEGHVIPAHPLALTADKELDERRQRALSRYYMAAGAGGLAVGVHTTQFEIHESDVGLYEPVLALAREEADRYADDNGERPIMVAGLVGRTDQAVREARLARDQGYDCGLVSLSAFKGASIDAMIEHMEAIAEVIPVFGFYLQPPVGGRRLSYEFWRRFAGIDNVVAIKMAPFDRYQTIDVVRGVADSGRAGEIALYTGNDDNIIVDLLTKYPYEDVYIRGGLLGQFAVWTKKAVDILEEVKDVRQSDDEVPAELLTRNVELTDANAALFDPSNGFQGSIAGIHEILRRQGLLEGRWTINPEERLSSGQMEEIDRVCEAYPHLQDDAFIEKHIDEWLS